jgi:membrane-associated phospholipid phosphatase
MQSFCVGIYVVLENKRFPMSKAILFIILISLSASAFAQSDTVDSRAYKMKYGIDIPIAAAGTAWTLYGFSKIYGRDPSPVAKILALNTNDVNSFDRPITKNYSESAASASNDFFYGSMPLPLILLFDKKIRNNAANTGLLYLEAMAVTGTIYTTSAMLANRYRPYAYNPNVDMAKRTRGGARNSFFAGHVALVGTSTFFMATVYSDYHPEMKNKWILYTAAGALTATTGYLRLKAGQHFKTDVMLGAAVGTLSGIFIPRIHKNRHNSMQKLSLLPFHENNATGFSAFYKL